MNFELTGEQALLKDSLTRYLREHHDFDTRRRLVAADDGTSLWRVFADDLGILGAPFPVDAGGFGGGAVEAMIVMEALGAALVVSPYLETVVLAGSLLRQSGHKDATALMKRIASGDACVAVAIGEATTRFGFAGITARAISKGAGFRISGTKAMVVGAARADHLLVLARLDDRPALFVVDCDATGVSTHDYALIDDRRASDMKLAAASGTLLVQDATRIVERAIDEATAALCAEAVGVMRRMLADTIDYTKQRRQFDQPLAAFQVLQHRMVDMAMLVEQAVSATYLATLRLDAAADVRAKAVSAAKVTIAKALRRVGQEAVQMHGGMGLTDLLPISHYFKRATVMESQFGSADHHVARYAVLTRAA